MTAPGTITITETNGLGPVTVGTPAGRQTVTPASVMCVAAIGADAERLRGRGLDWGAGTGLLTIAAALVDGVDLVVGLELDEADPPLARANAHRNGVSDTAVFVNADSYRAIDHEEQRWIDDLRGCANFLIGNPPASRTGDGLDWRREMLRGGLEFAVPGAPVLVQISYQYSIERIEGLVDDVPGYAYEGLAGSTEWVPFDQSRADLSTQLVEYAAVEAAGGAPYSFSDGAGRHLSAVDALDRYRVSGESPLSKWQMHRYRRES